MATTCLGGLHISSRQGSYVHTQHVREVKYNVIYLPSDLMTVIFGCFVHPIAMGFYSAALCYGFDERTCREGLRLGNFGLMYLDQNKESVNRYLPGVYLSYYGFAAVLKEPIQYCIMQHRRAYDIGMKTGNTSDAFFNLAFMIPRMIDVGENLLTVKKEILFYQQLAEKHNHPGELNFD